MPFHFIAIISPIIGLSLALTSFLGISEFAQQNVGISFIVCVLIAISPFVVLRQVRKNIKGSTAYYINTIVLITAFTPAPAVFWLTTLVQGLSKTNIL